MIVGVPTEIKDNEYRVALAPAGARELARRGHTVLVEAGAGRGSSITDEEMAAAGAQIVPQAADVWSRAQMILKVKEPLDSEYAFLREGLILFTFLHLAPTREVTEVLMGSGVTAIGYETVQLENGTLALLTPMSEVAGRMAPQTGAQFLERNNGGRGVLLGGVSGVTPARVVILGAGIVGSNAALVATGLGADVTILDKNLDKLRHMDNILYGRIKTVASNSLVIEREVAGADLVIGAVLVPGGKAPVLVTEAMVEEMKPGAVIVDVAVDQGGCIETSRPTTHSEPTFVVHDVVHYGVTNMPGAVPNTSTYALTNATLPYVEAIADAGFWDAVAGDTALARGVNVVAGHVTVKKVAEAHHMSYTPLAELAAAMA